MGHQSRLYLTNGHAYFVGKEKRLGPQRQTPIPYSTSRNSNRLAQLQRNFYIRERLAARLWSRRPDLPESRAIGCSKSRTGVLSQTSSVSNPQRPHALRLQLHFSERSPFFDGPHAHHSQNRSNVACVLSGDRSMRGAPVARKFSRRRYGSSGS
jgi:hypothetical protein